MTKNDVDSYIEQLTQLIAIKLGFNEVNSVESNREYIRLVDAQVYQSFEGFINNYKAWYSFHVERCNESNSAVDFLTDEQGRILHELIHARDESRQTLRDLVAAHGSIQHELNFHVDAERQMDLDLKERSQKARTNKFKN